MLSARVLKCICTCSFMRATKSHPCHHIKCPAGASAREWRRCPTRQGPARRPRPTEQHCCSCQVQPSASPQGCPSIRCTHQHSANSAQGPTGVFGARRAKGPDNACGAASRGVAQGGLGAGGATAFGTESVGQCTAVIPAGQGGDCGGWMFAVVCFQTAPGVSCSSTAAALGCSGDIVGNAVAPPVFGFVWALTSTSPASALQSTDHSS